MPSISTPEDITFASFHHSQGSFPTQTLIFAYMQRKFGVEPQLQPSEEERDRYIKRITPGVDRHIPFALNGSENDARLMVDSTFEYVRGIWNTDREEWLTSPMDLLVHQIARDLVNTECKILNLESPWVNDEKQGAQVRRERMMARVRQGKASFLHYYGRDKRPTGHAPFDKMYADVWQEIAGGRDHATRDVFFAASIRILDSRVQAAEQAFMAERISHDIVSETS